MRSTVQNLLFFKWRIHHWIKYMILDTFRVFTYIQQRKIILIVIVAAISSLIYNTAFTVSFAQVNNTSANNTSTDDEQSTQDYISNIRLLLNQTIDAYSANDTEKAKELATTAYLDNFEHIEDPIGEELSEEGEELLREQLGAQIDSNASIEEIKQTVNAINKVLDEAEKSVTS